MINYYTMFGLIDDEPVPQVPPVETSSEEMDEVGGGVRIGDYS